MPVRIFLISSNSDLIRQRQSPGLKALYNVFHLLIFVSVFLTNCYVEDDVNETESRNASRESANEQETVVQTINAETLDASRQNWFNVFFTGENVGRYYNLDFVVISKIARAIPEPFRSQFYDGVAHGVNWPFEDLPKCRRLLQNYVNPRYSEMMYFGPIQSMAKAYGDSAGKITEYVKRLPPDFQPYAAKGISIGLMRYYKLDLSQAIPLILQLDESLRAACFEELGWWLGERHQADLATINTIIAQIPEKYHGEIYHGYIRGVEIIDETAPYEDVIARIDPAYHKICYQALGWKILNWNWVDPDNIELALKNIRRKDMLPAVRSELQKLEGPPLGPPPPPPDVPPGKQP